ncbi:hypothetical protein [Streptomyces sp. NBC_00448]|uniref:hypothetical protein n=1 Tax=Streptomyces sp. NBC_00448 TaxID=2903652 RepID=UPI002E1C0F50
MAAFGKSPVIAVAVAAASVLTAGAVAVAAPGKEHAAVAAAVPVAVAPYARAAAVVDPAGRLVRAKGIASVKRVAVGEYCVKISASGFDIRTAVPQVSSNLNAAVDSIISVARSAQALCGSSNTSVLVRTSRGAARQNEGFTLTIA